MPFEKVFEPNVDFTPLREMHNDFLDFSIDSNTLKVLNRDAYRMFVGKLIEFNNKYAPKIDRNIRENEEAYKQNRFVNTKYPIDIDKFFRINHRWRSIAMKYYARLDDPTGLKKIQEYRPEDQFPSSQIELLKESMGEVCFQLSKTVSDLKLGTPYTDSQGNEQMDYTKISYELMELTLLATHAYTDVFKILDREYGPNALEKMRDLAASMHPITYYDKGYRLPRRRLSRDYESSRLIENPLLVKNMFAGYTEENFVGVAGKLEQLRKKQEEKAKKTTPEEREKIRQQNEAYNKQKQEEDRIAEEQRREEQRQRIVLEEEERKLQDKQNHIQNLRDNNQKGTNAFAIVENEPNPSIVNQTLYAYFDKFAERMGIDQSKLNAQSIIQAASIAYINENTRELVEKKPNDEPFLKEMAAIYNQITRITYAAYIEKCINEKRPIDLNIPSNEALDLMGVAMYAMYPTVVNGENKDMERLGVILKVINGTITTYDFDTRGEAIELAKLSYQEKDVSLFTVDAEARYESFTAQKRSSSSIVEETAEIVNSYRAYKINRADPEKSASHTAFNEGEMRKKAMDAAYALEKRVETRYGSRLARFFRYFSYAKQRDELARVKGILAIPQEQRVADHIKAYHIEDIFADANYKINPIHRKHERAETVENDAKKYITQLLENHLGKDNIPKITNEDFREEEHKRYINFQELTPDAIAAKRRYEEEQRLKEEAERERIEEAERKRKEEEERKLKEEEERKRKEEEIRKLKAAEERERKEKERLINESRERYRKEQEEKKRQEEEEYQKRQKEEQEYRANFLIEERKKEDAKEQENYNNQLKALKEFKDKSIQNFEKINGADAKERDQKQKRIDVINNRLTLLNEQKLLEEKNSESDIEKMNLQVHEIVKKMEDKKAELRKSKQFKKLVKEAEAEEKYLKENRRKHMDSNTEKIRALQNAINNHPEVMAFSREIEKYQTLMSTAKMNLGLMNAEIGNLETEKAELEKDVNRINHDLELARETKEYAEKSYNYFESNRDEITKRYASDEIGFELLKKTPEEAEFYKVKWEPLYETEVSKLELNSTDPLDFWRQYGLPWER